MRGSCFRKLMSHIGGPSEVSVKGNLGTKDNKLWRQETNLIVPCKDLFYFFL